MFEVLEEKCKRNSMVEYPFTVAKIKHTSTSYRVAQQVMFETNEKIETNKRHEKNLMTYIERTYWAINDIEV